jgi:hypothetical protein
MSKHFLSLEIRTQASTPPIELEVLPIITIMQDTHNNYFFATGIDPIKSAILGTIPHLDSNYRYPLLFQIQIIPGDRTDTLIATIEHERAKLAGQRQRATKQN